MTPKDIIDLADFAFGKKSTLNSLWQEIADNFYPERAHFTTSRSEGSEFADHLMTSYPILVRRDLGNSIGAMLRDGDWFEVRAKDSERENTEARRFLEYMTQVQFRVMYDRAGMFVRATNEGDHDFASFGQTAISVRMNKSLNGVMYRCWHLRDMAWMEDAEQQVTTIFRKWKPTAQQLKDTFGEDRLHFKVKEKLRSGGKDRFTEFECLHVVMTTNEYAEGKWPQPWTSLYVDVENVHLIEEVGQNHKEYVIPRWQTAGTQYAVSPATIVGLADARLIQQMALVILEAGEKATNPPLLATEEALRSDMNTYAGGVTYIERDYDERYGRAVQTLNQDYRGIPIGMELLQDYRAQLAEAFYINKLGLPPMNKEATAFEIAQRVQEWIRAARPLFGPTEVEYNAQICEATFDLIMAHGGFGSPRDAPRSLQGADVEFRFDSPIRESKDRIKGQEFIQAQELLARAAQVDPTTAAHFDVHTAFRDALGGVGLSHRWIHTEEDAASTIQQIQEAQQAQEMAAQAAQVAAIGKDVSESEKAMAQAAAQ